MGTDLHLAPMEAAASSPPRRIRPTPRCSGCATAAGVLSRFVCGYLARERSTFRPPSRRCRACRIPLGMAAARCCRPAAAACASPGRRGRAPTRPSPGWPSFAFVEAMRRYMETLPPGGKGWLPACATRRSTRLTAARRAGPRPDRRRAAREVALRVCLVRAIQFAGRRITDALPRAGARACRAHLRDGYQPVVRVAIGARFTSPKPPSAAPSSASSVPPAGWRKGAARP